MKNKTFLQSVACAFRGLFYALKTEKNFKYYTLIALVFLAANLILGIEPFGYLVTFVAFMGAFASECLNTAIEHICDKMQSAYDPAVKIIKDVAAASILCWGIAYFVCEAVLLIRAVL